MKPWTGKRICNIPGDSRVFMTYAEYTAALAAYRATLPQPTWQQCADKGYC